MPGSPPSPQLQSLPVIDTPARVLPYTLSMNLPRHKSAQVRGFRYGSLLAWYLQPPSITSSSGGTSRCPGSDAYPT